MTSNRSFKLTAIALVLVMVVAAAVPVAATTVDESNVPEEAEVGEQISASFTLTELYQEPNWDPWTLQGETELNNVTWTLTYIDAGGSEFDTVNHDDQTFEQPEISADNEIMEVRVEVTGEVPDIEEYSYPDEEKFLVAELMQVRGEEGAHEAIGTWEAHHFTTTDETVADASPGTKEVRQALDSAQSKIDAAKAADGDLSNAEQSFQSAISSYENGDFENALSQAERAQNEADEAREDAEATEQRIQLLMFGGVAVVILALAGGGFWWWRQQGDDYDKLG